MVPVTSVHYPIAGNEPPSPDSPPSLPGLNPAKTAPTDKRTPPHGNIFFSLANEDFRLTPALLSHILSYLTNADIASARSDNVLGRYIEARLETTPEKREQQIQAHGGHITLLTRYPGPDIGSKRTIILGTDGQFSLIGKLALAPSENRYRQYIEAVSYRS